MRALILAAGDGTRMQPLTASMPKSLLPVAGKPLIMHMLDALKASRIKRVTILVSPGRRDLEQALGDGSDLGMELDYLVQERPLGTANAIGTASAVMSEPFLCMNGDVVVNPATLKEVLAVFRGRTRGKKPEAVVTGAPVDNPRAFGVLECDGEYLVRLVEKPRRPPSNLANAGVYVFTPEVFSWIERTGMSPRGEYEITDTLTMMASEARVACAEFQGEWVDVGRPWDLLRANKLLMADLKPDIRGEVQPNVTIEGPVVLGRGSRILNGSYITGPVIIGEDTVIGPNAYIRPSTFVGNGCKVGAASEVKNSIIMDNAKVPHHNYVGDSVLGPNCNLGSGTKIANLRLDGRNIRVSLKGKMVDTGLRKLGVIMGEGVKTGINASIDPGTVIGQNCFIGPGTTVGGFIAPGTKVY